MYQKTTLDNGLRVLTSAMPYIHSVSICIFVGVGSRYETDTEAGVSHFIEHLCFKGTPKRPTAREVSEAIEGVGGILNAGTDRELTVYWCKVAQAHFPMALEVLIDILLHSNLDPVELEKERQVIIEEIHMYKDSPQQRVNMLIDELLWPEHPLGRDIAGSKESVSAITRDAMCDYLANQYQPANTVVTVAGDIKHQEVVNTVNHLMGDWMSRRKQSGFLAYKPKRGRRLLVETRDTEQSQLCLALPGLSLLHPKRFALALLNVILGEGMSSRLFTEIRDKMGLAYSIQSSVEHLLDSGSITISAGVETRNLSVAVKAIVEQLALLKEPISESELSKAKEQSKGRLILRMEDSRNVASWVGGQEILIGSILSVDQAITIIEAITVEELSQLAQELLVGSQLRLAVVGPVSSDDPLEELLKL